MSVRIYQLSKQLGMDNKELITLLKERGYEVASASSTISNIDAEALVEEMSREGSTTPAPEETEAEATPDVAEAPAAEQPSSLPAGRIVKSASELREAEAASKPAPVVKPAVVKAPVVKAAPAAPAAPRPPAIPGVKPAATPPKTEQQPSHAPRPAPTPAAGTPPAAPTPAAGKAPATPPAANKAPAPPTPAADGDAPAPTEETEVKIITLKPPVVVRDFAGELGLKPFRLISELMEMGIFASINQTIEEDVASKIAEAHGFMLEVRHRGEQTQETPKEKKEDKPKEDESKFLEPRPPVVCVLGHVDHGKTTLLDSIRNTSVVAGEAGGITQHIGAYQVEKNDQKITFIDTPGHAAFSKMRERGANVTDIAVLVVAADDGFMPQTDEALKFAQKANVPVVVAINKMDSKGANIDRVKQQLQERNIASEDWGGETLTASVSALKGEGIGELLEAILLQAEVLELKANPKCPAEGIIVESQIEVGRGSTATAIIRKGTLKVGDAIVCGPCSCKVRALMNERGERLKSAPPATPVSILGWSDAPNSGASFVTVKNDREAKRLAEENAESVKREELLGKQQEPVAATMENLLEAIESQQEKVFRVLIKADVHGSAEALQGCLEAIQSDKVNLEILGCEVGPVSKNDITMASASEAAVIAFNVKLENGVQPLAKHHNIRIIQHNIIYELIDQVKEGMAELLEPERVENKLGGAEVRQVFSVAKGIVAGCMVTEGRFLRDAFARVHRKGELLHDGRVTTLKRFKDDVNEVRAGYECGIKVSGFSNYEPGDMLECYEVNLVAPEL